VEVKGDTARLLSINERVPYLFGKDDRIAAPGKRKEAAAQLGLFAELERAEEEAFWGERGVLRPGATVLDRVHQAMVLFATERTEAIKRFLGKEGAGNDPRFWRLAQSLSVLYPAGTDEKRWVDGVLARKKGLGGTKLDPEAGEVMNMSKMIELSDEQYRTIEQAAATRGRTPDALVAEWIEDLRDGYGKPRVYETEEWFRHLGMSDEVIEQVKREVREEAETDADT
jgi:hypothetical protein